MTLTKSPTTPMSLYAMMGADSLLAHLQAIAQQLEVDGITISPNARIGLAEIEEGVIEHLARSNPSAFQRIAKGIEDAGPVPQTHT